SASQATPGASFGRSVPAPALPGGQLQRPSDRVHQVPASALSTMSSPELGPSRPCASPATANVVTSARRSSWRTAFATAGAVTDVVAPFATTSTPTAGGSAVMPGAVVVQGA